MEAKTYMFKVYVIASSSLFHGSNPNLEMLGYHVISQGKWGI